MELLDVSADKKIMMSNSITSGRFDVTSCQLDILFMLLSMLEKNDDVDKEYIINAMDIETLTKKKWNYQQLRKSTEDFGSRMFEIENEKSLKQLWLWSKVEYYHNTGSFGVVINPHARQYFFELKDNFTSLQLKSVLNCSSKYAKRLYAIACQYRNMKFNPMPLDDFKKMLGLIDKKGNDTYENATNLKTKVLDVAKKQINENTDVQFDYKLTKVRSRSYNTIHLYIDSLKPEQLSLFAGTVPNFEYSVDIQRKITHIESSGISKSIAEIWAVKYYKEFVAEKNIMLDDIKNNRKDIKDFPAYLVGVFKKKGYL
jgi:plasmid replication initiation protein